jgi:predicted amidohydrolase YtcJ
MHKGIRDYLLAFILILFFINACSSPASSVPSSIPQSTISPTKLQPTQTTPLSEPADVIFHNGNIITIEKILPLAKALAVRGNLIQSVGDEKEVLAYRGAQTVMVDLQGKTLMPGFVEGHTHYTRNGWGDGVLLKTLMDNLLAFGLTSITEMHSTDDYINAMLQAEKKSEILVRMNIFGEYNCGSLDNGKSTECISWYRDNPPILDPNHMVRVPGVKIFVDGAGVPGRGCAYKSFPWPDNITDIWPDVWDTCGTKYGDLYLSQAKLTQVVKEIQDRGYRAAFHVMGDAAIEITLNAIQTALAGKPNAQVRHQIQHNSVLRPDLLPLYEKLDVLASVRGAFNTCDAEEYRVMFGENYYQWNANRFELANMKVHAYSEGDFGRGDFNDPTRANPLNPIRSLYGFVTHQQLRKEGSICQPPDWIARHKISVQRALEMLTIESAYAVSLENNIGSLKPGKFADLIILSDDPLTIDPNRLGDLKVWMTMVNGVLRYCATGKETYCPQFAKKVTAQPVVPTAAAQFALVPYACDSKPGSPVHISKDEFVQTFIRWGAATVGQINDDIKSVQPVISINGKEIKSQVLHGSVEKMADKNVYFSQTTFDVGVLNPGSYQIRTVLNFKIKITDGYDEYGPGSKNPQMEGTCMVIVG